MKKISAVGFAALFFATNAMATFMETETMTVECRWVVDLHTTSIHGIPQDGNTMSEPRCEPLDLRTRSGYDRKTSDDVTLGSFWATMDFDRTRLSDVTVGCLKAILAAVVGPRARPVHAFGASPVPPECM